MRLVFAGTPHVALPALQALLDSTHELVAVLTRPDAPSGRGRRLVTSPVADLAVQAGVEVLKPLRPSDPVFLDRLRELAPDCCPVVAYGALVPQAALDIPAYGWVNLHFSLLPAWRGAAPVQHAVLAGDEVTGASTFLLEPGLDTGPVFGVMTERIRPHDTSGALLDRLAHAGAGLLLTTLHGIADGSLAPVAQPSEGVSRAPKILVADAEIDWSATAVRLDRLVRACTPSPGVWTTLGGDRLKLGVVEPVADGEPLLPGEVSVGRLEVLVGTGTQPVRLSTVQPAGKKPLPATDWARGARLGSDVRLGVSA